MQREFCLHVLLKKWKTFLILTIKELSSLIKTLISTFPRNKFGPLYYRELDKCKVFELKKAKSNFYIHNKLTKETDVYLQWWKNNYLLYQKTYSTQISQKLFKLMNH